MNVLLLNGSPHAKGCTYTALTEVAQQLEKRGIETEMLQMGASAQSGCTACGQCKETGRCIFGDDVVNTFLDKMEDADGVVVGSPVYYASPNGSLISVLDRAFYAGSKLFAHKPAAVIASARRGGTTASLDALLKYFTFSQSLVVTSKYWTMVHGNNPDEVKQDLEGMQVMRTLADNMAWALNCIDAAAKAGIEPYPNEPAVKTNFIR